jgi:hypothetical protein
VVNGRLISWRSIQYQRFSMELSSGLLPG